MYPLDDITKLKDIRKEPLGTKEKPYLWPTKWTLFAVNNILTLHAGHLDARFKEITELAVRIVRLLDGAPVKVPEAIHRNVLEDYNNLVRVTETVGWKLTPKWRLAAHIVLRHMF